MLVEIRRGVDRDDDAVAAVEDYDDDDADRGDARYDEKDRDDDDAFLFCLAFINLFRKSKCECKIKFKINFFVLKCSFSMFASIFINLHFTFKK